MKQLKKAVSLIAVLAFLITALIPVSGFAADVTAVQLGDETVTSILLAVGQQVELTAENATTWETEGTGASGFTVTVGDPTTTATVAATAAGTMTLKVSGAGQSGTSDVEVTALALTARNSAGDEIDPIPTAPVGATIDLGVGYYDTGSTKVIIPSPAADGTTNAFDDNLAVAAPYTKWTATETPNDTFGHEYVAPVTGATGPAVNGVFLNTFKVPDAIAPATTPAATTITVQPTDADTGSPINNAADSAEIQVPAGATLAEPATASTAAVSPAAVTKTGSAVPGQTINFTVPQWSTAITTPSDYSLRVVPDSPAADAANTSDATLAASAITLTDKAADNPVTAAGNRGTFTATVPADAATGDKFTFEVQAIVKGDTTVVGGTSTVTYTMNVVAAPTLTLTADQTTVEKGDQVTFTVDAANLPTDQADYTVNVACATGGAPAVAPVTVSSAADATTGTGDSAAVTFDTAGEYDYTATASAPILGVTPESDPLKITVVAAGQASLEDGDAVTVTAPVAGADPVVTNVTLNGINLPTTGDSSTYTATVSGTGTKPTATVGTPTENSLPVTISVPAGTPADTYTVTVSNAAEPPLKHVSATISVVVSAAPTLAAPSEAISQTVPAAGTTTVPITFTGTDLAGNFTAQITGNGATPPTVASPVASSAGISVPAVVTVSADTTPGEYTLKVTSQDNPDLYASKTFTITAGPQVTFNGTPAVTVGQTSATVTANVTGIEPQTTVTLSLSPGSHEVSGTVLANGTVSFNNIPLSGLTAAGAFVTYTVTASAPANTRVSPSTLTFKVPEDINIVDETTKQPIVDNTITMTAGSDVVNTGEAPGTKTVTVTVDNYTTEAEGEWQAVQSGTDTPPSSTPNTSSAARIQIQKDGAQLKITVPLGVTPGVYQIQFVPSTTTRAAGDTAVLTILVQGIVPATPWIKAGDPVSLTAYVAQGDTVVAAPDNTGGTWALPGNVSPTGGSGTTRNPIQITSSTPTATDNPYRITFTPTSGGEVLESFLTVSAPTADVPPVGAAQDLEFTTNTTNAVLMGTNVVIGAQWATGSPANGTTYRLISDNPSVIPSRPAQAGATWNFNASQVTPGEALVCIVANSNGTEYRTESQKITVYDIDPVAGPYAVGSGLSTTWTPAAPGNATYRWTYNGTTIAGATGPDLPAGNVTAGGTYVCYASAEGLGATIYASFTVPASAPTPPAPGNIAWAMQIPDDPAFNGLYPTNLSLYGSAMGNGKMPSEANLTTPGGPNGLPCFWHNVTDTGKDTVSTTVMDVPENSRFEIYVPFSKFPTIAGAVPAWQHSRDDYLEWEYRTIGTSGSSAGGDVVTIPVDQGFYGVDSYIFTSGPVQASMDGYEFRLVHRVAGTAPADQEKTPWIQLHVTNADQAIEVPVVTISSAPAQTQDSVTVAETGNVTFTATVQSGLASANLSYQWQSRVAPTASAPTPSWTNISGATDGTYTISNVTADLNNMSYRCQVANNSFSGIQGASNALTLQVNSAPGAVAITAPTTASAYNRYTTKTATFEVEATTNNGDDVTYQWYRRFSGGALETTSVISAPAEAAEYLSSHPSTQTAIAGATSASYTTPELEEGVYEFVCRVSNAKTPSLTANSTGFYVVVTQRSRVPQILKNPGTRNPVFGDDLAWMGVTGGTTVTMSCTAAVQSQEPLTYQWQASQDNVNWSDLAGATSSTLSIPNVAGTYNTWYFRCRVTNPAANTSATSASCQLFVWNRADVPIVSATTRRADPTDQTKQQLVSTATLASGAQLQAIWVKDGQPDLTTWGVVNANANGVYESTITATSGTWTCVWVNTNAAAPGGECPFVASNAYVYGSPASGLIVVQPVNVTAAVGTTATFSVGATLTGPITAANGYVLPSRLVYVWQRSTDGGITWKNCTANDGSGQFTSTFSIPVTQRAYDYATAANMQQGLNPYAFRVIVADRTYGEFVYSNADDTIPYVILTVTEGTEQETPSIVPGSGVTGLEITTDEALGKVLSGTALTISKDGTTVADLLDMLAVSPGNDAYTMRVVNAANEELQDTDIVGTGYKIQLVNTTEDNRVVETVTIIVRGDVMGTGRMSLTQLVRMAACLKTTDPTELTGAFLLAGDLDGSGNISLTDLVQEAAMYRTQILNAGSEPAPTAEPTVEPTAEPTTEPTGEPTTEPTSEPTVEPTAEQTAAPTETQAA